MKEQLLNLTPVKRLITILTMLPFIFIIRLSGLYVYAKYIFTTDPTKNEHIAPFLSEDELHFVT